MDKNYAQKIILDVNKNYSLVSDSFSRARSQSWPEVNSLLRKYINKQDKVLDLGCGNGRFFNIISDIGSKYIGADNCSQLIKIAQKKNPQGKFLVDDALSLNFSNESFTKIFSISVIHHIPSKEMREKFLQECYRLLEPKGLIIITAWNLWRNKKHKINIFKNFFLKIINKTKLDFKDITIDWYGTKNCYIHCFTKKEILNLVKKNKFKLIDYGEIKLKNNNKLSNYFIVAQKD